MATAGWLAACVGWTGQVQTMDALDLPGDGNTGLQSSPNDRIEDPNRGASEPSTPPPPAPGLATVGRVVFVDPNRPFSAHSAQPNVALGVHFRGASLSMTMSNPKPGKRAYFDLTVDGAPQPKFAVSGATPTVYPIAQGLDSNDHTVWLTRRNEPSDCGTVDLHDVDVGSDGELLAPPPVPGRRIEMFGASIEMGWCCDDPTRAHWSDDTQEAALAWPQLTAGLLDAALINTSIAGAGMRWDHGGYTNGLDMPLLWKQVDLSDPNGGCWDPNSYPVDVALINLIGNDDFGLGGIGLASPLRQAQWQSTAMAFTDTLFQAYPKVTVIFVLSAVYTAPQRTYMQSLMASTVAKIKAAGQTKIALIEMDYDPQASSLCDGHPTPAAHRAMAMQAAAQIKELLNW